MKEEKTLREKLYAELKALCEKEGMKAIVVEKESKTGEALKIKGKDLIKILRAKGSPYGGRGIAIWREISDETLERIYGRRAEGKNKWASVGVSEENYKEILTILFMVAKKENIKRNEEMAESEN